MQLDENQVTHHYILRLRLVVKLVENNREEGEKKGNERKNERHFEGKYNVDTSLSTGSNQCSLKLAADIPILNKIWIKPCNPK